MPFLRILRDKRGHETTYLMHLFREGSRNRSRVLYMFSGPQAAGVGVRPIDAGTRAALAQLYPDIAFDWRELVAQQQVVELAEPFRPKRRKRPAEDGAPDAPADAPPESGTPAAPRPSPLPSAIDGATPEEQMAWLAEWHPRVRDLIPQRFHDEVRREALGALAARLDPSGWTDDATRAAGLADAREAWERLVRVFTRRRRRRRGAGRAPGSSPPSGPASSEPA